MRPAVALVALLAASPPAVGTGGLVFEAVLVDPFRAGGEPVMAAPPGALVYASHPGYTHAGGPDTGFLLEDGQDHVWRSVDDGRTWAYAGALGLLPLGPRDLALGISDPDTDASPGGRVYLIQLAVPFREPMSFVSWSDDGGTTWTANPEPLPIADRPWIAAGPGGAVYAKGDASGVWRSADGGRSWQGPVGAHFGNLGVDKRSGAVYAGGSGTIAVSTDGGQTFTHRSAPGSAGLWEPAIDDAGNVYLPRFAEGTLGLAVSPDQGRTWRAIVVEQAAGSDIWPWVAAGAAGNVALVWLHADEGRTWFVEAALVRDALGAPVVERARATPQPVHIGGLCEGLGCQLGFLIYCLQAPRSCTLGPGDLELGDRRLGDFFTALVGPEGGLHIAVGTTTQGLTNGLSKPLHVKAPAAALR